MAYSKRQTKNSKVGLPDREGNSGKEKGMGESATKMWMDETKERQPVKWQNLGEYKLDN